MSSILGWLLFKDSKEISIPLPPVLAYCSKETFCLCFTDSHIFFKLGVCCLLICPALPFLASNLACPDLFEMLHKRQRDFAPDEPARKRFRRNVADL